MPIAHVNNCDLYYEVKGNGPDVVFIHGEDHGIEMLEDQVAHLSPQYRCTTYFRRGHGRSQLTPYGYSLRNQTLDLAMLLECIAVERAVVLGVAMATTIAASYALEYPGRVRDLVLASWYELDGYPLMEERRRQKHRMTFAGVPRLKEIACPVLGICGEDDPSPDQPDLLAGLANFEQVWIPGARRFTMIEAPSAFNAALASFLARLAP